MATRDDVRVKVRFPDGTIHHFKTMYQAHQATRVPYGTLKSMKFNNPTLVSESRGYRFKFHPEA